jgi:hypothetical protein
MTETQLYQGIVALLEDRPALLWHHCRDSRQCDGQRGFPDLVIIGYDGVIFAELKAADGDTSAEQDLFGYTIESAERQCSPACNNRVQMWQVWRPDHLDGGVIADQLDLIKGHA